MGKATSGMLGAEKVRSPTPATFPLSPQQPPGSHLDVQELDEQPTAASSEQPELVDLDEQLLPSTPGLLPGGPQARQTVTCAVLEAHHLDLFIKHYLVITLLVRTCNFTSENICKTAVMVKNQSET